MIVLHKRNTKKQLLMDRVTSWCFRENLRGYFPLPLPDSFSNFFEPEASLGEARVKSSVAKATASRGVSFETGSDAFSMRQMFYFCAMFYLLILLFTNGAR